MNLKHPTINVSIKHDILIGTIPLQQLVKDLTKPPKPAKWKKKFSIDIPPPKDKESLDSRKILIMCSTLLLLAATVDNLWKQFFVVISVNLNLRGCDFNIMKHNTHDVNALVRD